MQDLAGGDYAERESNECLVAEPVA